MKGFFSKWWAGIKEVKQVRDWNREIDKQARKYNG